MACISEIICLGDYCTCGDKITINLDALESGVYLMKAEFNGVVLSVKVPVTIGERIEIPNIFNEDYTHIISFYKNGIPIYDTKFSIRTIICIAQDEEELDENIIKTVSVAGNTITDERIVGREIGGLIIDDAAKNTGYTKPVESDTITFTDGTTLIDGQAITILLT